MKYTAKLEIELEYTAEDPEFGVDLWWEESDTRHGIVRDVRVIDLEETEW